MIRFKYIIPVLFLVIGLATSWSIVSGRRRAVERMLNDAGRDRLPVIVVANQTDTAIQYMISAPDHDPVKLMSSKPSLYRPHMFFTVDGIVHILKGQTSVNTGTSDQIELPEIHIIEGGEILNDIFAVYSAFHLLEALIGMQTVVTFNPTGFQIDDFKTGETTYLEFEDDPPGYDPNEGHSDLVRIIISEDKSVLVGFEAQREGRYILWRYDIEDGIWTAVIKREQFNTFGMNPDGSIIGLTFGRHGPIENVFIDGYTGETLHTVYGTTDFIIGTRWIACVEAATLNPRGVILIDMGNHWYERRITFPVDDFDNFAMYEPPEGGVGEMLRMRRAGL
ncbi:hypothetical protein KAU08_06430 [bacterium]|nr:hypothetical protein [bacterium]